MNHLTKKQRQILDIIPILKINGKVTKNRIVEYCKEHNITSDATVYNSVKLFLQWNILTQNNGSLVLNESIDLDNLQDLEQESDDSIKKLLEKAKEIILEYIAELKDISQQLKSLEARQAIVTQEKNLLSNAVEQIEGGLNILEESLSRR